MIQPKGGYTRVVFPSVSPGERTMGPLLQTAPAGTWGHPKKNSFVFNLPPNAQELMVKHSNKWAVPPNFGWILWEFRHEEAKTRRQQPPDFSCAHILIIALAGSPSPEKHFSQTLFPQKRQASE